MIERFSHYDRSPELATKEHARVIKERVKELTKVHGSQRMHRDGLTATFQLDSKRLVTCRHITRSGDEYNKGIFVSYWETLAEYEDGSSVQLNREFSLTGRTMNMYFEERVVHLDSDENEIPYSPMRMQGMNIILWNRWLKNRKAEVDAFNEVFDDRSFYGYQADTMIELLALPTAAHLVACEDDTVDGR
jgi:hypothetical protein